MASADNVFVVGTELVAQTVPEGFLCPHCRGAPNQLLRPDGIPTGQTDATLGVCDHCQTVYEVIRESDENRDGRGSE